MYLWKLLHVFEEVVPGDTLGDPVGGRLNTGSCNRSASRPCNIICMSIIYIRIFFIGYYIVYYIYYWSGEWLAHRLMEGIEAVLVVVAGSVMQGPPGDQVVLNNHGDNVTTYSAKWWLRQDNPVMEGRDLYIRHVIFASDSFGGRKRCTDKLLTNSPSFRQALGCLYSHCLSQFWYCNWGQAWTQHVSKENPNFVCWNTWHFPLSWWWNNQVFCGEHSHLICRNSIDFCSLPGEIWEDFVQVMLRALWRERFEIGSNLPTIILATECLLGFPAKFFPFHQDLMTTRFELSRSKLLQLWKQGMIENKLFFLDFIFGPILEARGSDNIQCDGSAVSLDVHFQKWKWQAVHQLFSI